MSSVKIPRFFWAVAIIIFLMALTYFLVIGKAFFMPLITAIIIWYMIIGFAKFYTGLLKNYFVLPEWISLLLSFITSISILSFIGYLITANISDIISKFPEYKEKFILIIDNLSKAYGIDISSIVSENMNTFDFSIIFLGITNILSSFTGNLTLILFYVLFLLLEYKLFHKKIQKVFSSKTHKKHVEQILKNISTDINTYFKIKTFTSFLTGFVSYLILKIFGVDFAEFWGILIFLLNYIPTIGSIVGVIFPSIISLVQFQDSLPLVTIIILFLILTQIAVGNILEPKIMGDSLNLSGLVIMISLTFWGMIWGIFGMLACVPFMVIFNIVFSKFESTKPIAVFLSSNGNVK